MAQSIYVRTAKNRNYFLFGFGTLGALHFITYIGYIGYTSK